MDSVPPIFPRPPITDLRESRVHDRSSQTLLAYHYTLGLKKKKDFPSRTNSGKQVVSCPRAVAPIPIYVTANQNDANFRLWFESWKRILHINLMTGAELTSLWSPYAVWFEERDIHSWKSQATVFEKIYAQQERIGIAFANSGIIEKGTVALAECGRQQGTKQAKPSIMKYESE